MRCPFCGESDTKVIETTEVRTGVRRRRECKICLKRFTTVERALGATPLLVKNDGTREEFDKEKLMRGITLACTKRPVSTADIDRLASMVESYLQSLGRFEVPSKVVGDRVIDGLKNLDPIAYIRYAIIYLGLEDLGSIRAEIDKLLGEHGSALLSGLSADEEEIVLKLPRG
jgi:transcriptional repressor NrdR